MQALRGDRIPPGLDWAVTVLILVSISAFCLETLPDLSPETRYALDLVETGIVILFTFEYAVRVATAERKLSYIFSFNGIVDLLAILPFYLSLHGGS